MADNIRATPRNEFLGLLADAMYGGLEYMKDPRRTQQMQGLAGLLESTGIPKTTERMAYGEDLTNIGRANVPLLKPETAEAMMTVAPFAPVAGRVAGRMIKATEGMPVGMGIKDVGKGITSNISQFTGFKNTTPYGKAKEVAAYLDRLNIPYTINKSKTTNSAYLEIQTGKGDFDYPMQFRFSDHSTDLPHQNRQIFTNPKPDPNFDLDVFKDGGHDTEFAVNKINELAAKINPITTNPKSPYPQQAALDLAQQRAALPVEQGGLGLAAGNTADQRAAAMLAEDVYHGTNAEKQILNDLNFNLDADQRSVGGIWTTKDKNYASWLADQKDKDSANVMSLKLLNAKNSNEYDILQEGIKLADEIGVPLPKNALEAQELLAGGYGWDRVISDLLSQNKKPNLKITNFNDAYHSNPNEVTTAFITKDPSLLRLSNAAFDPFRKDVATAAAMGVAAPNLLAAEPTPKEKRRQSSGLLSP